MKIVKIGSIAILASGLLALLMMATSGCIYGNTYRPTITRNASGTVEYRSHVKRDGDVYWSTISRRPAVGAQSLRLSGKAQCMAVDPEGLTLAVGITPMAGPNQYGYLYPANEEDIVFIDAEKLSVTHSWTIRPPNMPAPDPSGYRREICRFDKLAIDRGRTMVATYYWKPTTRGRKSFVTLWEFGTGKPIRELPVPSRDAWLAGRIHGESLCSLAFSQDGKFVAAIGTWPIKEPHAKQPDAFVAIWRTSDAQRRVLRTKGYSFLWNLCFDSSGNRLACWTWAGNGMGRILIWSVSTGDLIASKDVKGRVLGIVWDDRKRVFSVRTEDGSIVSLD